MHTGNIPEDINKYGFQNERNLKCHQDIQSPVARAMMEFRASRAKWPRPVILTSQEAKAEDHKFKATLG